MGKLIMEKTKTIIEPVETLFLLSELIIKAPTRMIAPIASPAMPMRKTIPPSARARIGINVSIVFSMRVTMAVRKKTVKAFRIIRIAPISDRMNAAVGFSAIVAMHWLNTFINLPENF